MKLELSLYRNLLRRLERVRVQYHYNADNVVFILFGIALYRQDFLAAGYGNSLRAIAHTCFARPSVQGCTMDTPNARLAAAFTAIRTLTEAEEKKAKLPGVQMQLPTSHPDNEESKTPQVGRPVASSHGMTATTCSISSNDGSVTEAKDDVAQTQKAAAEAASKRNSSNSAETHKAADDDDDDEVSEKDIEVQEEDGVVYGIATIILESKNKRQFKLRNKLIINHVKNRMPPYRYLLPPEPLYAQDNLQVAPFPFMVDALVCLSAAAAANYTTTTTTTQSELTTQQHTAKAAATSITCPTPPTPLPQPPLVCQLPCSESELLAQLSHIPTRTVTQTGFVEVEVFATPIYTAASSPETSVPQRTQSSSHERTAHDTTASSSGNDTHSPSSTSATPCPAAAAMIANVHATAERAARGKKDLYVYSFYICLRNRAAADTWHFHVMSNHFLLLTPATETTTELTNAGLGGTMGMLEPGESWVYILGVIANAAEGVLRGTIQINAFDMNGTRRSMDVAVGPTRFTATRPQAPPADFTSDKHTAFVGRVAGAEEHK